MSRKVLALVFSAMLLPAAPALAAPEPVSAVRVAIDLGAVTDIGLMTVEGENDDISGVGQTQAAHILCPNIPNERRVLYVQPHVGHYGVFNGRRFREEIYPRVRDFIASNEALSVVPERSASAA